MKPSKSCGSVPAASDASPQQQQQQAMSAAVLASATNRPAWSIHPKLNPPAAGTPGSTSPAGSLSSGLRGPTSSNSTSNTPGTCSSGHGSMSPAASILPASSAHTAGGTSGGVARTPQPLAARSKSHQVLSAAQGSRGTGVSSSSTSSQAHSNLQPGLQPEAALALQQQLARSFAAARILEGGQCRAHPAPKASRAARLRRSRTSHAVLWSLSSGAPRPLSRSSSRAASSRHALGLTRSSGRQLGTRSAAASLAAAAAAEMEVEAAEEKQEAAGAAVQATASSGAGVPGSAGGSKEQDSPLISKETAPAAAAKSPGGVVPAKSAVTLNKVVVEVPASGSAGNSNSSSSSGNVPDALGGGQAAPGNPSSTNGSGGNRSGMALAPDVHSRASRKALIKHRATTSNATAALAAASMAADGNSGSGAAADHLVLGGSKSCNNLACMLGNTAGAEGEGSGCGAAGGPASPHGTSSGSNSGQKPWAASNTVPGTKRRPSAGGPGLKQGRGVSDSAVLEAEETEGASAGGAPEAPARAAAAVPSVSPAPILASADASAAATAKASMPGQQATAGGGAAHKAARKQRKKGFFWCCSVTRFSSDEEPVNAPVDTNSQAQAVKAAADAKGPVLPELDFQRQQDTIMVGYAIAHSTHTQSTESLVGLGAEGAGGAGTKEPHKAPGGSRALFRNLSERAGGRAKEQGGNGPLGLELPTADRVWRGGSVPNTPGGSTSGKRNTTWEGAPSSAGQLGGSSAGEPGTLLSPGSPTSRPSVTWGPAVPTQGGAAQAAVAAAAAAAVKQERVSSSSSSNGEGQGPNAEQVSDSSSAVPAAAAEDELVELGKPEIHEKPWQQFLAAQRAKSGSPCNKIPLKMSARSPASTARSTRGSSTRSTPRSSRSPGRGAGHVTLTVTPGATLPTESHPGDLGVTLKAMALQALHSSKHTSDSVDVEQSVARPVAAAQAAVTSPGGAAAAGTEAANGSSSSSLGQSAAAPVLSPVQQMQQVAAAVTRLQQANATLRGKTLPRPAVHLAGGDATLQQGGSMHSPRLQHQPWHVQQQQQQGAGAVGDAHETSAAERPADHTLAATAAVAAPAAGCTVSLGQLAELRTAPKPQPAAVRRHLPAVAQLAESPCVTTLHLCDLVGPTSSSHTSGTAAAAAPAKEASKASIMSSLQPSLMPPSSRLPATAAAVALIQAAGSSLATSIRTGSSRRLSTAVAAGSSSAASSRRTTCSSLPGVEEMGRLSGGGAAMRRSTSSLNGRSLLQMDPVGVAAAKFKVPEGVVSAALDSHAPQLRLSDAEEAVSFRWLPHARLRSRSPGLSRAMGMGGVRGKRGHRVTRCTLRSDSRLLQQTHNFRSFAEADVFLGFTAAASSGEPPAAAALTSRQGSQLGSRRSSNTGAAASMVPISNGSSSRKGVKGGRTAPASRVQQRLAVQQLKAEGAWRRPLSPRGGVDCKQSPRGAGGAVSAGVAAAMLAQLRGQQQQQQQEEQQHQEQPDQQLLVHEAESRADGCTPATLQGAHSEEVAAAVAVPEEVAAAAELVSEPPTADQLSVSTTGAAAASEGPVRPAAISVGEAEGQEGAASAAAQPATPVRTPRITPQEVAEPPQEQEVEDAGTGEGAAGLTSPHITRVRRGDSFRVSGEAGVDAVTEDAAGTTADADGPGTEEDVEEVVIASIDGAITALSAAPVVVARLSAAGGRLSAAGGPAAAAPSFQSQEGQEEQGEAQVSVAGSALHTTFRLDSALAAATATSGNSWPEDHHPDPQQQQQQQPSSLCATKSLSKASKAAVAGRTGPSGGISPTRASIKGVQPSAGGALARHGSSMAAAGTLARHGSSMAAAGTLLGVSAAAAGVVGGAGVSAATMRRISAEQRLQSIDREALRRSLPYLQRGNANMEAEGCEHSAFTASSKTTAAAAAAAGSRSGARAGRSPTHPHPQQVTTAAGAAEHLEGGSPAAGGSHGGWSPVCRSPVPAGLVDLDSEEGLMQLEAEGQQWLEVLSQTSHDSEAPGSAYSPARHATASAMSTRRSSARRSSAAAGPGLNSAARLSSTDAGAASKLSASHLQQQQRRRSSVGVKGSERRSSAGEGSPERRLSRQESYLRMLQANLQHRHQQQAEHFQPLQPQHQEEEEQQQQVEQEKEVVVVQQEPKAQEPEVQQQQQEEEEVKEVQEANQRGAVQQEMAAIPEDAPVSSALNMTAAAVSDPAPAPASDAGRRRSSRSSSGGRSACVGQEDAPGAADTEKQQQDGLEEVVACQQQEAVSEEEAVEVCASEEGAAMSCGNCSSFSSEATEWEHGAGGAEAAGVSSAGGATVDTGRDWEAGDEACDE